MRWVDYQQDINRLQQELDAIQAHRLELETEAQQLRASQLYLDALDIKARQKTYISHPNELTIWLDQTP